jgi:hypothetical protein
MIKRIRQFLGRFAALFYPDDGTLIIDHDDNEPLLPPAGFSGEWVVHWPNRRVKFRGHYLNGVRQGEQTCYWKNGRVAQTGRAENGDCVGLWIDYHASGRKMKETDYQRTDDFVIRYFNPDGNLIRTESFVKGERVKAEGEEL